MTATTLTLSHANTQTLIIQASRSHASHDTAKTFLANDIDEFKEICHDWLAGTPYDREKINNLFDYNFSLTHEWANTENDVYQLSITIG